LLNISVACQYSNRHYVPVIYSITLILGVTNDVLTGAAGFNKTHVQVCVSLHSLATPLI